MYVSACACLFLSSLVKTTSILEFCGIFVKLGFEMARILNLTFFAFFDVQFESE